jgi:hypothetical protein
MLLLRETPDTFALFGMRISFPGAEEDIRFDHSGVKDYKPQK